MFSTHSDGEPNKKAYIIPSEFSINGKTATVDNIPIPVKPGDVLYKEANIQQSHPILRILVIFI